MTIQVSVLDLNPGPARRLGGESHFPLTDLVRIGLDLPLRTVLRSTRLGDVFIGEPKLTEQA